MGFFNDVFRFRAEGTIVPWDLIRQHQDNSVDGPRDPRADKARKTATGDRFADIQLRWMIAPGLGMPSRPFRILRRPLGRSPLEEVPFDPSTRTVTFDRVAAVIEVEVTAGSGQLVMLSASRTGSRLGEDGRTIDVSEMVGATSERLPSGSGRLRIRCSGATTVQVSIGTISGVFVAWLDDVLDSYDWEETEIVGLPFEVGDYQGPKQGIVGALTDPIGAARERLERGLPPIGWFPNTETSLMAPDWSGPDPAALVEEVTKGLRDEVGPLFEGKPPHEAARHENKRSATPDGSSLETTATIRAFDALTLPASSEAALALVLGFGTAYPAGDQELEAGAEHDYMVVAEFENAIPDGNGSEVIAAFIPAPERHQLLSPPQLLETRSAGLQAPQGLDQPWKDDAQAVWAAVVPSAALERPTAAAFARTEAGDVRAESLLPPRDSGGSRPLVPTTTTAPTTSPPPPSTSPGVARDRWSLVDGDLEIPPSAGTRAVLYSVALVDVYGIWSPWEDQGYTAVGPPPPRVGIADLSMAARYTGSAASCPTRTSVDVSIDWETRRPTSLHLRLVLFPTTRHGDPPGTRPPDPVAPPAMPWDLTLSFIGDGLQSPTAVPADVSVSVRHVEEQGDQDVAPGPDQGDSRRRYRLVISHLLDFTATTWWGAEVWARTDLAIGASTPWVPPAFPGATSTSGGQTIFTRAASPVPPVVPSVPQGPDVPLGSTPDSQGRSHARIPLSFGGPNPRKVSIWEVSESALRTAAGLPQRAGDTSTPSDRLVELRSAYGGLSAERRKSVFRRAITLDGGVGVADVPLPRGSTDIHLFAATATTAEGVESEWPQGGAGADPHEYLHAVMAPRLVAPAPTELRVMDGPTGKVVRFSVVSQIPVTRFELLATRSPAAARRAIIMGPPAAVVPATVDSAWEPDVPAEEGMRRYTAEVVPSLAPAWEPWLLRAIAVPVDTVGQLGLRGLRSPDSPLLRLRLLPPGPPTLAPVVGRSVATDAVAFSTQTDAPVVPTSSGDHRIRAVVTSDSMSRETSAMPVSDVQEVADPSVRPVTLPGSTEAPIIVRGPRSGGNSELAVWWTRPDSEQPVTCEVTLTDPLGRATSSTGTAPPVVTGGDFPLKLVGDPFFGPKGVGLELATKAPRTPDWLLEITATPRSRLIWIRPRPVSWSSPLSAIQPSHLPLTRDPIQVRAAGRNFAVLIRVATPFEFTARLTGPGGRESVVERLVERDGGVGPIIPGPWRELIPPFRPNPRGPFRRRDPFNPR